MQSDLKNKVQTQIVELITQGLESGSISEDRARQIAKMILEKLPDDVSDQELMMIIPKLDDEFTELTEIVLPIILDYERKLKNAIEEKVLALVRQKKFAEALKLVRQGLEYTSKLAE